MNFAGPSAPPWRLALISTGLLAACAGHPPHPTANRTDSTLSPAATATADGTDGSYDWRVLVPVPFGTKFKDIFLPLHEVLVFREPGAPMAEDGECYGSDAPAPQFVGRNPDEHLLCFRRDRLVRIRAAVTLGPAQGAATVRTLCDRWKKNARPPGAQTAPAPATAPGADVDCDGIDGNVHFSARLAQDGDPVLAVTLDSLSDR